MSLRLVRDILAVVLVFACPAVFTLPSHAQAPKPADDQPASEDEKQLQKWLPGLKDSDSLVRNRTAKEIGEKGIPILIIGLKSEDAWTRHAVAEGLGCIHSGKAVPALLTALKKEKDRDNRRCMIYALADIGPAAKEALPDLLELLEKGDRSMRQTSASAVQAIVTTRNAETVPALVKALKDEDAEVREKVALALLNIGPNAEAAIPALEEACKDNNADVREAAEMALKEIRKK
jgi:HEAT repeat protein